MIEVAEQRQRPPASGRSWIVAGGELYVPQLVEDAGLAKLLAEVAEQRQRLLQAGGGGRIVASQPFQNAELPKGALA